MSSATTIKPMRTPLISKRTRAYFAPVDRVTGTPTIFDPALQWDWSEDSPPGPWMDLGWIFDLSRQSESVIIGVASGMPSTTALQARTKLDATVSLRFGYWNKLTMALATGSQHMNVLAATPTSAPSGSGAKAEPAVALSASSTSTTLYLAAQPATPIATGAILAVDADYNSQTGFVGAGISGAYVASAVAVGNDPDYIRRITFNVARVAAVNADGGLKLISVLPLGSPDSSMKVQQVMGFVDREGGTFFQEWSALFVLEGVQGDKLFLHYPRLQSCQSASEHTSALAGAFSVVQPLAKFRALPTVDRNDGEQVLCYRTYQPARFSYV